MSLTFTLSGNSIQTFESIVTANMPVGQFRLSILSSSQSSSISLATPLRGYDMMSATLRKTDIESSLIFMTPIGEFQTAYKNQGILSSIVLVTPFRGYERMSASLSHSASSMTNILSTLSLDIPAGEFQVTLRHEGSLFRFTTSLEVMTPITGYERMSVSLHNSAENAAEIVSTITLNIPSGEYQLSFKHDGVDAKYTSALTMSTPYTGYERSSLVLRHSGFEDSSLSLNLPSGEYEVSLHNRGSHGQLSSSTTLKTPFQGYERVTFAIQHSASPSDMESSIAIELPTGQYKISAIREGHVSDFTFTIALTTPVIGYERMSATLRHSAPSLSSIKSALTIGEFQVSLDHAGIASEFLSTIAVDTPFSGYESMSISARHSAADRTHIQSAITLNIPSGEYQLSMDGNFVLPEYTVAMNIPDYERMFFTLSHSVSSAIVSFNIPCGHYEIKFDHEGARDQFTSTISMKTPINGFERLATTVRHSARDVSNIDSTISAETPLGHFEIGVKHTGTAERFTSTLSVATPFGGFENIAATAVHSANDLTNIVSSLKFSTPIGQYGAAFSHQGTSLRFRTTIDITSPHSAWEKMTFTIENNSPASTNIEAGLKIELPSGEYAYSFSHQGSAKEFTTRYVVNTPNSNNYDFEALVDHSARSLADIKSKAAIRSYWGNIGYDIKHKGNQQNFKTDITVTTPFTEVEDMSVTIEHDANSLENIQSSTETNTPWGLFKYQVSYSGRAENFRTSLNINTPFRGYEEMFAAFEHAGRDLSSIKTTARFTMPMGVFSAGVDHTGNLRKFVTIVEVNTPLGEHNYRLHLDNNVVDVYNMLSKAMLTIPSGEFSSSVHYNGNPRRFSAAFDINTPFETFRKLEIVMNHAASDFSQITTSASILTPMGTYGYDIKHNGDWKRMTSTIGVTTLYTGYENNIISIEHDASSLNHLQTTIKSGTSQFALNHHGQLKKMRSSLEISLPFQGFEQTGIKVETNIMDLSKLKSAVSVTTPIGAYAYDLQFNGSPKAFTSVFELSTPHQKMNTIKATANVDVSSLSALRLGSELVTPVGQYGFRMTHDGNMQGFRNEAELTTPHSPYNKFAYGINFSLSKNFRLNGELTTSVPSYERFTLDINHDTRTDGFRSSVDATTTVPNYSRFVVSIEHTGSLQSPKTIVSIQTPFPGHDSYTLTAEKSGMLANLVVKSSLQTPRGIYSGSFSQTGSQNDFRTEATLTLPLSGFERFAFEMNHKGDSELSRSHVQISTPFRNWENFGVRLSHDARDNIRSSLTINTAYPGFEEIVAALTHEGTAQNFETDFQITTPFNGYRNFGFNVNHGGHVNEFSTRGTIKLPIVEIPATTIAISHRRELTDFQTSVSVEYNNKKIESEAEVKKSTGRSGNNYEGTFTMTSPYEVLRRLYVTGVHSRNGDIKTGSLDAMYNGHQMVDFDYSYNTGALKNVEIQIRKPYGMSSKVNAGGNNNDATFNWDTTRTDSQVHFDLNMKNEEAEKELTIRAVLPSRTVGFTTTYANAEGRLTHTTEVMWDNSADAKASYHVELSKTTRRSQNIFDGRLSFASPVGSMDATFNHISNPGRQSTTEISIQRLSLRSEAVMTSNGFKHTMTAEHPKLPSNLKLVIEGAFEAQSVDGTLELTFDSEVFTFVGHLSDASNYRQTLYNAKAQLTHPNSNLDAAWEAQYKDDSDIIAVIMNGKYLTSSDLEMKTASLRADINKLRKALDLEIITPVETLALTATEKSHDVEQGIHLFEIVCTLGEHSIRGDFNVNGEDKMIEMKLYQDEDFLHLTAQMVSAIHAKAEVSTTVNGERRQHALAYIAISEEHLISTRFLLSPTLQQEVTQFFNQIQTSATYHRMSNTVQAAVENEIAKKKHQLTRAVQPFQPAIRFSIQQYTAIANGMQSAYDTIIQENHFHARDIITYVQSTLTDMR
ncbi:hypothetical protein CAPTEDRAFT_195369 [Capitella teleta]|uniref:VWFD domain-containing protein n=1 Tax=Capitella teleta TaxID=283909 RepID=R7USY8_CAPTE|nr:hypothetical protein CAPTEDRAFT_195369 [Capitella teleta]|eukprot:ELU06511.1 hypothetical protein CAPTEDRAFT_195369 [Capitella teleta]